MVVCRPEWPNPSRGSGDLGSLSDSLVAPTADFIADRSSLRLVVRVILAPIVFTIENPVLASLLFLAFIGAICGWRRSLHAPG